MADSIAVPTPGGLIIVDISHAGPTGQLVGAGPPGDAVFRPPTIFAAPLPTGSGARALGLAGAFTAVADDATAASWNPAGLTQLESPEVSAVYRFSAREDSHESETRELEAGRDRYNNSELNYVSAVYPFLINDRNVVFSMNYQESYDFTQIFTARFQGSSQQTISTTTNQTFYRGSTNLYDDANQRVTVTNLTTTCAETQINQLLNSSLLTDIDFRQRGTIDALSPAFAFDVTPTFSLGVVLNIYTDGSSRGNPLESTLIANYEGDSDSYTEVTDTRSSTTEAQWGGVWYGGAFGTITNAFSGAVTTAPNVDVESTVQEGAYTVEGSYREDNTTDQFYGFNATIGALWVASEKLTLGATVDLPWTGHGEQTRRIHHQVSTFDTNRVQVAQGAYEDVRRRGVEYTFPLYWAVGALWRWNDRFYTAMDISRTHWSQYSYKAEGEDRINPVNGEPYSSSALDDCWSIRCGSEYLCVLSWTEIPLRGGVFWEQRPATGAPDEYWGLSLGSGISLGKDPGKIVLDIAYTFERGEQVGGDLLSGQNMHSDVNKHQIFVSAIWHF
ncbi:MAG: outer membrane protein transport protein [Verrucomicrobia bacterium]|nr:outer membrane protein transport protein [Verrucomicrobiota bacterium]